jgi:8-oxo-dGTP diphosphatase
MKLLYGTSNPSKLQHMRVMLAGLNINIIGLDDIKINVEIEENGDTPLENAKIKAMEYYKASGIPTFSSDSGLYIEGLAEEKQPGVHVRRVNNKYFNDKEFINYYTNLINDIDEKPKAKFKNAICLVVNEENIFTYDGDDIADDFLLTTKVHSRRKEGFPLDSIALDIETGKYFVEIDEGSKNEEKIKKGFRNFFKRVIPAS